MGPACSIVREPAVLYAGTTRSHLSQCGLGASPKHISWELVSLPQSCWSESGF